MGQYTNRVMKNKLKLFLIEWKINLNLTVFNEYSDN